MLPLLGMTADPDDTPAMVAAFDKLLCMRDFGVNKGADLTMPGTGKWLWLPPLAFMHASWKGDVEDIVIVLDLLRRPVIFTYWHEMMGNLAAAEGRARGARMAEIIAGHRNRDLVIGNGPVVTRWWLVEGKGNPLDYWYDGATMYGVDCYHPWNDRYYTGEEMYGPALDKVEAAIPDVPVLIPELGLRRLAFDTTGDGRANAMRGHVNYLRGRPRVLVVNYWNRGGNTINDDPEASAWRELMAQQTQEEAVTVAKPWHLRARGLFLEHLDITPGNTGPSSDLDPEEFGIVGGPAHVAAGTSYHLGRDQLQLSKRPYSVYESPRDQAGLDNDASAVDVGWFSITIGGRTHNLRTFSLWLVAECKAGAPDTLDIREVIYSPDGQVVLRFDRLGIRSSGDDSHLTHTHVSEFRDATGERLYHLFERYLTEIGVITMAITSDDVNTIWGNGWEIAGRTPGRTGAGTLEAMLVKLDSLLGSAAADQTRDQAHAAALQAIADQIAAGGGSIDVAAILTRIDEKTAETNAAVEAMRNAHQAELDQLQAQLDAARAQLAAIPAEVVDEYARALQD